MNSTNDRSWRFSAGAALAALFLATAAFGSDAVFDKVVGPARRPAAAPYQPNEIALPEILQKLDYDTYRLITFRWEESLWFDNPVRFQAHVRELIGDLGSVHSGPPFTTASDGHSHGQQGESFERPGQKMTRLGYATWLSSRNISGC